MKVPEKTEFPGTGPSGNGISPDVKSQGQWLHLIRRTMVIPPPTRHTRTIPAGGFQRFDSLFVSGCAGVQSGQAASRCWAAESVSLERATAELLAIGPPGLRKANCPHRRSPVSGMERKRDHPMGLGRSKSVSVRRNLMINCSVNAKVGLRVIDKAAIICPCSNWCTTPSLR